MRVNSLPVAFPLPQEVTDPAEIAEICRFRAQVWRETGQTAADAFPVQGWRDPIDGVCRHWVIRDPAGQLLAAGRLSVHATLDEVHLVLRYSFKTTHDILHRRGIDINTPHDYHVVAAAHDPTNECHFMTTARARSLLLDTHQVPRAITDQG